MSSNKFYVFAEREDAVDYAKNTEPFPDGGYAVWANDALSSAERYLKVHGFSYIDYEEIYLFVVVADPPQTSRIVWGFLFEHSWNVKKSGLSYV